MSFKRDPETYLKIANAEEEKSHQGKLKIYLGAAPGVGKTYQMLSDALSLRSQGLDIVIGDIATHGREEVESLASAFEKVPLLPIKQDNFTLYALDVAGIIKRAPALVLVDEAAYSNPKDLQHPKRWQDILELIAHGIDVSTTLNIQHLESLNDVVTSLIGIPVYETVPDQFLEKANEIELIDLPSEDLIARLKQGKVYVPSEIAIATKHFFKKNNLDALRELALRIVAEQVSASVQGDYSKSLSASLMYKQDTLLVCVKNAASMPKLIRSAKRLSTRLKCSWIALFVDNGNKKDFFKVQEYLQLAESLGAKTQVIFSTHFVAAVREFIEHHHITQLVIGRSSSRFWKLKNHFELLSNQLKDIGIYGIELEHEKSPIWSTLSRLKAFKWLGLCVAICGLGILNYTFEILNVWHLSWLLGIIFLVMISVEEWGKVLSLTLFFLVFDFILNKQVLQIESEQWLIQYGRLSILLLMMSAALFYAKQKLRQAQEIEQNNGFLMGFYQTISAVRGREHIIKAAYDYLREHLKLKLMVFLPKEQSLSCFLPSNKNVLDDKEMAIVQWVYHSGQPAGKGTGNLIFSDALFLPLKGTQGCQGVIRFESDNEIPMSSFQKKNLMVCLQQLANILDAEVLHEQITQKDISLVQDKVRHDLLSGFAQQLTPPFKYLLELLPKELENSPYKQLLQRLSNHLQVIAYFSDKHLLETLSLQNMQDVIQQVLNHHAKIWGKVPIRWYVQVDLPKVPIQLDLMTVVIENILDNIYQHAHIKEGVEISIHQKQQYLLVSFADFGPGFSESELKKVFDYFYQVNMIETDGLGLGLAICERIISWHKGKIWAENRHPRGAIFNLLLPLENFTFNGQNNEPNV